MSQSSHPAPPVSREQALLSQSLKDLTERHAALVRGIEQEAHSVAMQPHWSRHRLDDLRVTLACVDGEIARVNRLLKHLSEAAAAGDAEFASKLLQRVSMRLR